jgi:hypothetical protein
MSQHEDQHAAHDPGGDHGPRTEQPLLDGVVEEETQHPGGEEGHHRHHQQVSSGG